LHPARAVAGFLESVLRNFFVLAGIVMLAAAGRADASGFFDADQDAVRADVEYLINLGILHMPVTTWPMPIDEIRRRRRCERRKLERIGGCRADTAEKQTRHLRHAR
jgi:hypothetical protein